MIDTRGLFQPGKRYRGFAPLEGSYVPMTCNVYTLSKEEVRLRYILPMKLQEQLKEGDTLYILVERGKNVVVETRVVRKEERAIVCHVDFVSEDRRKLPRVKIRGLVDVIAKIKCGDREIEGEVIDLSLSSLSVNKNLPQGECELSLIHRGRTIKVRARVVRSSEENSALEVISGNGEMAELLGRVYSELFIRAQRG